MKYVPGDEPKSVFDLYPVNRANQVFLELATRSRKNVKKKILKLQNTIKWPSRNVPNIINYIKPVTNRVKKFDSWDQTVCGSLKVCRLHLYFQRSCY